MEHAPKPPSCWGWTPGTSPPHQPPPRRPNRSRRKSDSPACLVFARIRDSSFRAEQVEHLPDKETTMSKMKVKLIAVGFLVGCTLGLVALKADWATPQRGGITPGDIVTADFNGDGRLDLAIANTGSNNVSVLLGNGA